MGIRGLFTFAESNPKCDFFENTMLSNTNLVIDGNNLRFYLYNRLKGRNCAFGGEYRLYFNSVTKYFQRYVNDPGCLLYFEPQYVERLYSFISQLVNT